MRTVGVDLAADPANTAACVIDWEATTVELLDRPVGDAQIVQAVAGCGMAALDVPLGWPDAFVQAVAAHHEGHGWPPMRTAPPLDRQPLRFRLTDVVTMGRGARPLSVSTDRIGVAAMRGARIQQLLSDEGIPVDRSGTTGVVVEGYPAAALRVWGFPSSGYKRTANAEVRSRLVAAVVERCGPLATASGACLLGCDDDELDAFVCAIVARAAALGQTVGPAADQVAVARREGWIHVPAVGLEKTLSA